MARDTGSQEANPPDIQLTWSGRLSLRQRILAVNIFAILMLAGSFFYLDSYRMRLIDERVRQAQSETEIVSEALEPMSLAEQRAFVGRIGRQNGARIRLADSGGNVIADSWAVTGPSFRLKDPADEPLRRHFARWLDKTIEFVVDAGEPKAFTGFLPAGSWPAQGAGWALATDQTHMIWASHRVEASRPLLLMTDRNARDIRRLVRAERSRLGVVIGVIALLSILLSLFLARTIAQPLRALASAALQVRYGRDREVNVPRLPARKDEIGLLARALSDMTHALRERIDATEAFAADVAHELKNPLASLSSAAQGLNAVRKPELRNQLQEIIAQDVVRLDRLISDISDLSRLDARLTRTRFVPVDIGQLIGDMLEEREKRGQNGTISVAFARPNKGTTMVRGDASQLSRVIDNLLSNAISFSPPKGVVRIAATRDGDSVLVLVDDEGPGIPENARESVFERFHSDRPTGEDFGQHSGLGLAIARTIVKGHDGSIAAAARDQGAKGARLAVRLPALEARI